MELIIILVVILIILIVICLFLKKTDHNMVSESFYPYVSSDTPEGSSALYGWGTDQSHSNWGVKTKQVCCPCPPPNTS